MPKMSLAQIRKCVYPFPVYEAHFSDGIVARMSFWNAAKKPWDFDRGRRVLAQAWPDKTIVAGYLEHDPDDKRQPWVRLADPFFTGEVIALPKRRASYKKALAELVAWADGDRSDDAALATARALVAA